MRAGAPKKSPSFCKAGQRGGRHLLRCEAHTVDRERVHLARLDLIGEHAERQGPRELRRLLLSVAVSQDARELRNLRNPATVSLLLKLDRQPHARINHAMSSH